MAEKSEPPSAEVADLQARMNRLADPVAPAVANAKGQAVQYVQQAQSKANDQAEQAAQIIRQAPLAAVVIACSVGYLFGRIVR